MHDDYEPKQINHVTPMPDPRLAEWCDATNRDIAAVCDALGTPGVGYAAHVADDGTAFSWADNGRGGRIYAVAVPDEAGDGSLRHVYVCEAFGGPAGGGVLSLLVPGMWRETLGVLARDAEAPTGGWSWSAHRARALSVFGSELALVAVLALPHSLAAPDATAAPFIAALAFIVTAFATTAAGLSLLRGVKDLAAIAAVEASGLLVTASVFYALCLSMGWEAPEPASAVACSACAAWLLMTVDGLWLLGVDEWAGPGKDDTGKEGTENDKTDIGYRD